MEIIINNNSSISEIQSAFSKAYPFLRIEFFKVKHIPGKLFLKEDRVMASTKAGELNRAFVKASIQIDGRRTVTELERDCRRVMGVYVQVLRKSGSSWIQTSLTDDWSLERQNREAELLSMPYTMKSREQKMEDEKFDAE